MLLLYDLRVHVTEANGCCSMREMHHIFARETTRKGEASRDSFEIEDRIIV